MATVQDAHRVWRCDKQNTNNDIRVTRKEFHNLPWCNALVTTTT